MIATGQEAADFLQHHIQIRAYLAFRQKPAQRKNSKQLCKCNYSLYQLFKMSLSIEYNIFLSEIFVFQVGVLFLSIKKILFIIFLINCIISNIYILYFVLTYVRIIISMYYSGEKMVNQYSTQMIYVTPIITLIKITIYEIYV